MFSRELTCVGVGLFGALLMCASLSGCASPASPSPTIAVPSSTTPVSAVPVVPPTIQLKIVVGDGVSPAAIASASGVVTDLSGASGTQLTYAVNYGDGPPGEIKQVSTHVY